MLAATTPLLPQSVGFDERAVTVERSATIRDGLGGEVAREVSVDTLKNRFFVLGLQTGVAVQMFVMSVVMMVTAYEQRSGAIHELSRVYYPLFRCLFLACFFFSCYGVNLYVWKRCNINYRVILGVTHAHNYHSVVRASFGIMTLVFFLFVLYILTLTTQLTPNKHVWPLAAAGVTLLALLWPLDWMAEWSDRAQRYKLVATVGRVLASPFTRVSFARTFVADVLTSMPKASSDAPSPHAPARCPAPPARVHASCPSPALPAHPHPPNSRPHPTPPHLHPPPRRHHHSRHRRRPPPPAAVQRPSLLGVHARHGQRVRDTVGRRAAHAGRGPARLLRR